MRKIISVILSLLIMITLVTPALAATADTAVPLWNYTTSIYANLPTIDPLTGIADCSSKILASQYLPVKVVCELQKYTSDGWTTVKSWEATGNMQAAVQKYYAVYTGYWYRVKTTGYVYSNDNVLLETVSGTSPEQFYSGN